MAIPTAVKLIAIIGIVLEGLLLLGVPTLCFFKQDKTGERPERVAVLDEDGDDPNAGKYVGFSPYSRSGDRFKFVLANLPPS